MLWHIFDQLPDYCAWYEPLHPNLISNIHHVKPQKSHIGINDYWHNYRQLNELHHHHSKAFGQSRLLLENHNQWPELANYIRYLIDESGDKTAVLQFNRMDLRLGWLKNQFPQALIIHIKRPAYPLWISSRKHITDEQQKVNESHQDAYDLMQWSVNLSQTFPMLQKQSNRHAYYRHYFIWQLAQLMAITNADLQLDLHQHFFNSAQGIKLLGKQLNWNKSISKQAQALIKKPDSLQSNLEQPSILKRIEDEIDQFFKNSGLNNFFPSTPLSTIKIEHQKKWSTYQHNCQVSINELLNAINLQKDELTTALNAEKDNT